MDGNLPFSPHPDLSRLLPLWSVLHVIWGRGRLCKGVTCWPDLLCFLSWNVFSCLLKLHTSYGKNINREIISILSSCCVAGGHWQSLAQEVTCHSASCQGQDWTCIALGRACPLFLCVWFALVSKNSSWNLPLLPLTLVKWSVCVLHVSCSCFSSDQYLLSLICEPPKKSWLSSAS